MQTKYDSKPSSVGAGIEVNISSHPFLFPLQSLCFAWIGFAFIQKRNITHHRTQYYPRENQMEMVYRFRWCHSENEWEQLQENSNWWWVNWLRRKVQSVNYEIALKINIASILLSLRCIQHGETWVNPRNIYECARRKHLHETRVLSASENPVCKITHRTRRWNVRWMSLCYEINRICFEFRQNAEEKH